MKWKRHSPEQIIAKLREADAMLATGATIGQICQKLEVAEPTFQRWRLYPYARTAARATTAPATSSYPPSLPLPLPYPPLPALLRTIG